MPRLPAEPVNVVSAEAKNDLVPRADDGSRKVRPGDSLFTTRLGVGTETQEPCQRLRPKLGAALLASP